MNTAARRGKISQDNAHRGDLAFADRRTVAPTLTSSKFATAATTTAAELPLRPRAYIAADNRLMREALCRTFTKQSDIDLVGLNSSGPFRVDDLVAEKANILLLTSRGSLSGDVHVIRQVRLTAPHVRILLVGMTEDETEFFQYVRAGIRGYLPRDASTQDVLDAMRAVHAGKAVCPGRLCALLFRFFESEATSVHSAAIHPRLGLTRREQQIVPLVAQGMTNKEIANQFSLSEQTVKNHLYRMKHKVGAGDRFGIVHLCRTQGFLV